MHRGKTRVIGQEPALPGQGESPGLRQRLDTKCLSPSPSGHVTNLPPGSPKQMGYLGMWGGWGWVSGWGEPAEHKVGRASGDPLGKERLRRGFPSCTMSALTVPAGDRALGAARAPDAWELCATPVPPLCPLP